MIKKSDLVVGNIVPIYTDHQEYKSFKGMALLIEEDKSFEPSFFIKEEKDIKQHLIIRHSVMTLKKGQIIYYLTPNNSEWGLYFITQIGSRILQLDAVDGRSSVTTPLPATSERFRYALSKWDGIIVNNKNYVVISDSAETTYVITQAYYDTISSKLSEEINESDIITISKPYDYIIDTYDPKTYVYSTTRWKISFLSTPFMGDIKAGDTIWYRDKGKYLVKSKENNKIQLYVGNTSSSVITATADELYIDTKFTHTTYSKISYFHGTSSRIYLKKEKSKDIDKIDMWEEEDED